MKVKFLCANLLKCICIFLITSIFLLSDMPIIKGTKAKEILNGSSNVTYNTSEETELSLENEFATHYFSNLTDNFGVNILGSCGYIALGMLLGYYDSYWSDSFINENFEQKATLPSSVFTASVSSSPGGAPEHGLVNDIVGNENYIDGVDYLNRVVLQNYTQYLHFQLIKIGNDLKYYNKDGEKRSAGLSDSQIISLTEEYLYDFMSFNRNDIAIDYDQRKDNETNLSAHARISGFVVGKLLQGIPVLIASKDTYYGDGHVMIAYDYNWNTGTIYVHTGRREDNNFTHLELQNSGYEHITMAMALDIKTNHTHTDNYKYENTTYCPCSKIKENNEDPCDIPLYYRSTINFENLNCLVNNAYVTNNNVYVQTPHEYIYDCRSSFSLENVVAQVPNYGYDPYHMFLGWCLDDKLTTKVTSIPAGNRREIILYAKWRVDYRWVARHGELTITSAGAMNNASDQIYVGSVEHLRQLQSMGITKLTINFHINMWEVKNGTQYIYLYGGANGSKQLASKTFNVTSSEQVKCVTFTVNLSKLEENPYVYIRYNASETKFLFIKESHDWKNNETHVEISYVVDESDITGEDAADFIWRYENSLVLKCSNCKEKN